MNLKAQLMIDKQPECVYLTIHVALETTVIQKSNTKEVIHFIRIENFHFEQ